MLTFQGRQSSEVSWYVTLESIEKKKFKKFKKKSNKKSKKRYFSRDEIFLQISSSFKRFPERHFQFKRILS